MIHNRNYPHLIFVGFCSYLSSFLFNTIQVYHFIINRRSLDFKVDSRDHLTICIINCLYLLIGYVLLSYKVSNLYVYYYVLNSYTCLFHYCICEQFFCTLWGQSKGDVHLPLLTPTTFCKFLHVRETSQNEVFNTSLIPFHFKLLNFTHRLILYKIKNL